MSAPSAQEIELLAQFRTLTSDLNLSTEQNTDLFLLRWIRARDLNLDAAKEMLAQSLKWREENDIENILSWEPPSEFLDICALEFLGYDNGNAPVIYSPFGRWDLKKVVNKGQKDTFIRYYDQVFEKSFSRMKGKTIPGENWPVSQFVFLVDMKGLSMRTLASMGAVDMCVQTVLRFENNQPETLKALYVINANLVFTSLFAVIKPLLSQRTFGKFHIYGKDESVWRPALLESIPNTILPVHLGGTNANIDKSYADVPEEAKVEEEEEELGFLQVTVPAGGTLNVDFRVDEGNSIISYAFKTEKYDLAFAVNCDGKAYIEKCRVDSHLTVQEGVIQCDTPGDYIFTFDNSYSRLRTKALEYRIQVKTPEGKKQITFK